MKTTSRTTRTYTYTVPGTDTEVELPVEPSYIMDFKEPLISISLTDGEITIGYLADDDDCANPLEDCDGMGHIYEARRHGPTLKAYEKARGVGPYEGEPGDPYGVLLDVYEHGPVSYNVSGRGMQCQFDTARNAAIWVPDEYLRKELDASPEDRRDEQACIYAQQACDEYTNWRNGNCFGTVRVTYSREGEQLNVDSCWGYIGDDYAYQTLQEEFSS